MLPSVKLKIIRLFLLSICFFISDSMLLAQEQTQVDPTDPFSPYIFSLPEGYELIEGDVVMPAGRVGALSTYGDVSYWPGGIVPYQFDSNVTAANQTAMRAAMDEWEAVADIHFVVRDGDSNYIHIQNSTQNSSSVGMVTGKQYVNIYNWGWRFIMAHELAHTLGFWHEQSRSDRDTYVTIEWDRIEDGKSGNFDKHNAASHYGPYDFDSVMHYGQCSFSTCGSCESDLSNCRTITVKSPWATQWQNVIGQRNHLSDYDILAMSFVYPEDHWRFINKSSTSIFQFGSFFFPFKTFNGAVSSSLVPSGAEVFIEPGLYSEGGTYTKAMTLHAPQGGVTIGD